MIRLRGPWQCEPLEPAGPAEAAEFNAPGAWPKAGAGGAVRLKRCFNRPTGLEGHRVELVIESCGAAVRAALSGTEISAGWRDDFPLRLDITSRIQSFNELTLETAAPAADDSQRTLGLVTLEISEASGSE